jgi:hypothetical protein
MASPRTGLHSPIVAGGVPRRQASDRKPCGQVPRSTFYGGGAGDQRPVPCRSYRSVGATTSIAIVLKTITNVATRWRRRSTLLT